MNALLTEYGLTTESQNVKLVKSRAADVIIDLSDKVSADLVVMGTVGRVGIPGLFIGNTAEEVLQTTKASVLAVKPSDFESSVTAG